MGFEYKIIKRDAIVIVTLAGILDRSAAAALAACQQELAAQNARAVVFEMTNVPDIKTESFRPFALLAKGLKEVKIPYRYAGLSSALKRDLSAAGLISHSEAEGSLAIALKAVLESVSPAS